MWGATRCPKPAQSRRAAASVPIPKFASLCRSLVCELRNRRTLTIIDLVWLWFRSPHFGLAAKMMRTSEPPHFVPAPPISAGDRGRVVDVRGLRVENAALANPCLRLGVGFLPVRQKHDSLPAREAAHVDPRLVTVGDLVQVEVLVLFRREVQIHLRALE